jgi:hypothetical protein
MTDEHLDGTNTMSELLGEGQRVTYQTGNALAQRVVEPLDVIGFTGQLADRLVLGGGNYPCVHHILIGVKRGGLTIDLRNLCPQSLGTLTATITHVKGNHLTCLGVHGEPNPLLVRLPLDEAGHFVGFHCKPLNHHIAVTAHRLDMQMIRQGLEALHQKAQEPLELDTHGATDAAQ